MGRKSKSQRKKEKGGGLNKVILSIGTTLLVVTLFCTTNIVEEQHALVSAKISTVTKNEKRSLGGSSSSRASSLLDPKLRVAVFGQTSAYGGGLIDKSISYPHLLSGENAHDYAHNSLGPNHYAICLDSIIHFSPDDGDRIPMDKVYDILILDYWLLYDQGLELLARRLHSKYPHAMMIFLKTNAAAPHFFRRRRRNTDGEDGFITFTDWVKEQGLADRGATAEEDIKDALRADEGSEWYVPHHDAADVAIERIAEEVEGIVLSFPSTAGDQRMALIDYLDWYDHNVRFHLNVVGHQRLAHYLKLEIQKRMFRYGNSVDDFIRRSNAQTPQTVMNDYCDWWWYHGKNSTVDNRGNPLFREIDEHNHHWVMEINEEDCTEETANMCSFFATHKGTEPRDLYLSYMRGPFKQVDRPGAQYPNLVGGTIYRPHEDGGSIPFHIDIHPNDGHDHFDFVTTLVQRQVPPHVNYPITMYPIYHSTKPGVYDVSNVDKIPFRLVGYAFTNNVPMEWEFGPRGA